MDSYPVDIEIDPEQVVRWLLVERQRGASGLQVAAWRFNEPHAVEADMEDRLGDAEREDLSDETTVAMLEIEPTHAGEGWRMAISVEGELEPVVPGEDASEDDREPIDLDTFYLDFIRPGRGTATITAEAESAEAEAHLDRLLHAIETNSHVPEGRTPEARRPA